MKKLPFSIMCTILIVLSVNLSGQVNVEEKVDSKTNQGVDKGLNAIEGGIKGVFKKKDKSKPAENPDNKNPGQDADQKKDADSQSPAGAQDQPALQSYSKYDFIPGEKVIFYEDFSQDAVGDFPALWNTNGSAEVVTTNLFPGKWMKFIGNNSVWTDELLKLPENYTIEFDIITTKGEQGEGMAGYYFRLMKSVNAKAFDPGAVPGKSGFVFCMEYFGRPSYRTYINGQEGEGLGLIGYNEVENNKQKINQKYHMSIWVQKSRVRLYQNETKLFDLPKAFPVATLKMDRIRFEEGAGMVSNIRIAVGAPDLRNKLLTEGKLVTYGIYFDVNKDVVKPESYGTLKGIADVLTENPDVRVKIVGYTDSDGADAANLDLSKRRGASVKNELAKNFSIDAARLESDGMGETKPVAPNDTPVNKALNRRVEFIKL